MAPQMALQVLVVDDNPGILRGLTRLLQRDGHTVETAAQVLHAPGQDVREDRGWRVPVEKSPLEGPLS